MFGHVRFDFCSAIVSKQTTHSHTGAANRVDLGAEGTRARGQLHRNVLRFVWNHIGASSLKHWPVGICGDHAIGKPALTGLA